MKYGRRTALWMVNQGFIEERHVRVIGRFLDEVTPTRDGYREDPQRAYAELAAEIKSLLDAGTSLDAILGDHSVEDHMTFTDFMIATGLPMDERMVVIECTSLYRDLHKVALVRDEDTLKTLNPIGKLATPPFEVCMIEWRETVEDSRWYWHGCEVLVEDDPDGLLAGGQTVLSLQPYSVTQDNYVYAAYESSFAVLEGGLVHTLTFPENSAARVGELDEDNNRFSCMFAVYCLTQIHDKASRSSFAMDQITHRRPTRRKYKRQHGKDPSPYFQFVDVRLNERQDTRTGGNGPSGRTHRTHSVRGHFRHYRTGRVSWIRPHVRGSGGGLESRPYRVVLPDQGE
jgi:hypothetical protein